MACKGASAFLNGLSCSMRFVQGQAHEIWALLHVYVCMKSEHCYMYMCVHDSSWSCVCLLVTPATLLLTTPTSHCTIHHGMYPFINITFLLNFLSWVLEGFSALIDMKWMWRGGKAYQDSMWTYSSSKNMFWVLCSMRLDLFQRPSLHPIYIVQIRLTEACGLAIPCHERFSDI